ncbi:methionyl-tRNA formyltransferase [Phaeobacter gallaeciensis]|uniref:Methionyl-tRNA formyltransferase n=2 Tax=Roseobacteraceae TaxID=2854170 RepID=A0A366WLX1_9RHOB|nr:MULTISPECIES: formyl transferase [Roseobacteraceae]MBT3141776.1 formyl transferase [Falsiruegeria litorea]MBT8167152.1 formyl transferase [Falsiruegeria litorea]RBW50293.1 methionyl-tRNA formyltransferase [Phaeobacter gallaeciensis]
MSLIVITGDHPRHKYLANQLAEAGLLSGWVIERRKPFMPEAPAGLGDDLTRLFNLHFKRREEAEERFFGTPSVPKDLRVLDVTPETLNDVATRDFIRAGNPNLVLSYGCHKLTDQLIAEAGCTFWNTHGGFSPQYRGVTTHFWPSYMLEPQMTGVTMHETTSHIDGGAVIHQNAALELHAEDGLHDLAARTVKAYADEIPALLGKALQGDLPAGQPQKTSGKIWIGSDWRPEHLRLIYDTYEDRISAAALRGEIEGRVPTCVSLLKG